MLIKFVYAKMRKPNPNVMSDNGIFTHITIAGNFDQNRHLKNGFSVGNQNIGYEL
jgi:hypothetical protein